MATAKVMLHSVSQPPTEHSSLLHRNHRGLSCKTAWFLSLNRSLNLTLAKIPTLFSWFLARDFNMNYTLFALCAVNLGSIINIPIRSLYLQRKVRYVLITFELLLAICIGALTEWHSVLGLFTLRLFTAFFIAAIRSSVNATIGVFTTNERRHRTLSIMDLSFPLSALGFIGFGAIYHFFGYPVLFTSSAAMIVIFALFAFCILPPWTSKHHRISDRARRKSRKNSSVDSVRRVFTQLRMQLIAISVLLNKIGRNALYYTFSQWMAVNYSFNALQTGYMTLCIIGGSLCGTVLIPKLIHRFGIGVHVVCKCSAILQITAMLMEIAWDLFIASHHSQGEYETNHWMTPFPLWAVCTEIFLYFCGCQVFYNKTAGLMVAMAPSPKLLPAVNVLLLITGLLGAVIGTIGSTVWYQWGGHLAIAIVCAAVNVGCLGISGLLWYFDGSAHGVHAGANGKADTAEHHVPVFKNDVSYGLPMQGMLKVEGHNTNNHNHAGFSGTELDKIEE